MASAPSGILIPAPGKLWARTALPGHHWSPRTQNLKINHKCLTLLRPLGLGLICHTAVNHCYVHIAFFRQIRFPLSILFIINFLQHWSLNTGPSPWATLPALFCNGIFWHKVSRTIFPGWLWTVILLISASWVVGITGVSHRHLTLFIFCE
jgi:hypothetical protein